MAEILNLKVEHFYNGTDIATAATYQDETGANYSAQHAGRFNEAEMRDYITYCRRHDRNKPKPTLFGLGTQRD